MATGWQPATTALSRRGTHKRRVSPGRRSLGLMAHCPAARRIRRELDKELADNAAESGTELMWTAADRAILERISATADHITDLTRDYAATGDDVKLRLKLAGEIRLQDAQLTRLLKQVKTEPPPEPSLRSIKAQRAARVRWDRDATA